MRNVWAERLLLLTLFLLPWQTRWIFSELTISGAVSEYGRLSLYAVEFLILFVILLRGAPQISLRNSKAVQAMYLVLAAGFFSLTFSDFYHVSLMQMFHLIMVGALFVALADERTNVLSAVWSFVLGLIVPSLLGWYQVIVGSSAPSTLLGLSALDAQTLGVSVVENADGRMLRAHGSYPHPNIFGGVLAVGIMSLSWLREKVSGTRAVLLVAILAALFSSTLMVTFSRSAWISLFVALGVFGAMHVWKKVRLPQKFVQLSAVVVVVFVLTLVGFSSQVFSRFDQSLPTESRSTSERVLQYQSFDDVFFSQPILGVGSGAYTFSLSRIFPGKEVWAYQPIHNVYALILAEVGVLGLLALLYWVIRIDQVSASLARNRYALFSVSLGTLLIFLGLFDHYLWSLWPGLSLVALSFALLLKTSEETKKTS